MAKNLWNSLNSRRTSRKNRGNLKKFHQKKERKVKWKSGQHFLFCFFFISFFFVIIFIFNLFFYKNPFLVCDSHSSQSASEEKRKIKSRTNFWNVFDNVAHQQQRQQQQQQVFNILLFNCDIFIETSESGEFLHSSLRNRLGRRKWLLFLSIGNQSWTISAFSWSLGRRDSFVW